tara:strand:+ start:439 stop:774 length:336 start_codon:yes stop_codon:yes gene_type:complete
MTDYNWCHNPDCHKIETQSRVRGTGDNKVLRTRKIALNSEWIRNSIYAYFCNQNCLHSFLNKFAQEIANTYSVKQPSETPIKVEVKKYGDHMGSYYEGRTFKTIKVVENSS